MHWNCSDGIINPQIFQQVDSQNDQYTGDAAKQDCARRSDPIAGASNCDEPGKESVCGVARVPLFCHHVAVKDGAEPGCACG